MYENHTLRLANLFVLFGYYSLLSEFNLGAQCLRKAIIIAGSYDRQLIDRRLETLFYYSMNFEVSTANLADFLHRLCGTEHSIERGIIRSHPVRLRREPRLHREAPLTK